MMKKLLYQISVDGIDYLIDKEVNEGDIFYQTPFNIIGKCIKKYEKNDDIILEDDEKRHYVLFNKDYPKSILCFKPIACEYPHKVEGLLQYKLPDEAWERAWKIVQQTNIKDEQQLLYMATAWHDGYYSNKNLYTEEQVRETLRVGVVIGMQNVEQPKFEGDFNFNTKKSILECKQYLKSLNNHKEIESVEVETERFNFCDGDAVPVTVPDNTYVLNEKRMLTINKINYGKI